MPCFSPELIKKAEQLLASCRSRGLTIATAESCTGGLLSALLTEIPGSSDVFTHGYVTYANAAKKQMIGVKEWRIKHYGAVSEEVATSMAEGARKTSGASLAIGITGIAGPGGATKDKPVGLVHLACARAGFSTLHLRQVFSGDRAQVRLSAIETALELLQRQFNQ